MVYVREGVAVWFTKHRRIMGRLSLIRQQLVMFMAWMPYTEGQLDAAKPAASADKAANQATGQPACPLGYILPLRTSAVANLALLDTQQRCALPCVSLCTVDFVTQSLCCIASAICTFLICID